MRDTRHQPETQARKEVVDVLSSLAIRVGVCTANQDDRRPLKDREST